MGAGRELTELERAESISWLQVEQHCVCRGRGRESSGVEGSTADKQVEHGRALADACCLPTTSHHIASLGHFQSESDLALVADAPPTLLAPVACLSANARTRRPLFAMTTVHIPTEVLDYIINFARGSAPTWDDGVPARDAPPPPRNATLLSASLVSKSWAASAQRALFRHCIFSWNPRESTYAAWLESPARLRNHIESLWIRPGEDFHNVLAACAGLKVLDLGSTAFGSRPMWEIGRAHV